MLSDLMNRGSGGATGEDATKLLKQRLKSKGAISKHKTDDEVKSLQEQIIVFGRLMYALCGLQLLMAMVLFCWGTYMTNQGAIIGINFMAVILVLSSIAGAYAASQVDRGGLTFCTIANLWAIGAFTFFFQRLVNMQTLYTTMCSNMYVGGSLPSTAATTTNYVSLFTTQCSNIQSGVSGNQAFVAITIFILMSTALISLHFSETIQEQWKAKWLRVLQEEIDMAILAGRTLKKYQQGYVKTGLEAKHLPSHLKEDANFERTLSVNNTT